MPKVSPPPAAAAPYLHKTAPNTCPKWETLVLFVSLLWHGTVPSGEVSLLWRSPSGNGAPWGGSCCLDGGGRRVQGALTPPSASELSLKPWPFPCPEIHQPGILHALWWPFLALKSTERRAWGLWWPGACQGLQSGFSSGFVLESLTGSGWAKNSESFCIKSCLNPRLVVIYLRLGLPSLCPKTTRKQ